MNIDTRTMSPWAEAHRMLSNMRNLTVEADGKTYEGVAELTEEDGHVTLVFPKKRSRKK